MLLLGCVVLTGLRQEKRSRRDQVPWDHRAAPRVGLPQLRPQFLPRKFKMALCDGVSRRAVIRAHDIDLRLVPRLDGVVSDIYTGGGLGRMPVVGARVFEQVPIGDLLTQLEAFVSVHNLSACRDTYYL